jgi:hypothetical protein
MEAGVVALTHRVRRAEPCQLPDGSKKRRKNHSRVAGCGDLIAGVSFSGNPYDVTGTRALTTIVPSNSDLARAL